MKQNMKCIFALSLVKVNAEKIKKQIRFLSYQTPVKLIEICILEVYFQQNNFYYWKPEGASEGVSDKRYS